MSWSKSFTGPLQAAVLAMVAGGEEVQKSDIEYGASEELKASHLAQTRAAHQAISALHVPEGAEVSISASGHANTDGSGHVQVYISLPPGTLTKEAAIDQGILDPDGD